MRCTSPRTVSFEADGTTIAWSKKKHSKQYDAFQLPCGKCLECRLEYARQWAVRCVHEAQMHEKNCFITLTYDDEHLKSPKLRYEDFQLFMKRLRKTQNDPIGMFVTGEYGEQRKRPHWHAILFNYRPTDARFHRTTETGDQCYTSENLGKIWGKGHCEIGEVTFESAGYCARYAAKKLVHGKDQDHDYHPISKKSSKHAIGKKWLEKFWPDVFNYGRLVLKDGTITSIPRYYEKWFKENSTDEQWRAYLDVKNKKCEHARLRNEKEMRAHWENIWRRADNGKPNHNVLTPTQVRKKITQKTFEDRLQSYLKL